MFNCYAGMAEIIEHTDTDRSQAHRARHIVAPGDIVVRLRSPAPRTKTKCIAFIQGIKSTNLVTHTIDVWIPVVDITSDLKYVVIDMYQLFNQLYQLFSDFLEF